MPQPLGNSSTQPLLITVVGIGGMILAPTLYRIGVPCVVYESVAELWPLGVGINLQPNAVCEFYDLRLRDQVLHTIGVQARTCSLAGRNDRNVYAEPHGLLAGWHWPQYAVYREHLQTLLDCAVPERLGSDALIPCVAESSTWKDTLGLRPNIPVF
ncbi:hypothetical protein [Azohydromonas australica]|uniref:hypothetical protein n=1 Tax=Azohydromonas australica TaxID=364039 RepID=UPI000405BA16|nr:hypothetical protein [Azohydromonas australica]